MKDDTSNLLNAILNFKHVSSNPLPLDRFIGLINLTIFDRSLFEKNIEIRNFIEEVFKFDYLDYVYVSRSLISGRTTKDLLDKLSKEDEDLNVYICNFITYFENHYFDELNSKKAKNKSISKTNNANDKLAKWLKRL